MKCETIGLWILSILVLTTFSGIVTMRVGAASSWHVDGVSGLDTNSGDALHPFKTITQAITAASDGDTIMVASATYNEEVDITKGLSIVGAGAATTIIDGTGVTAQPQGLVSITAPSNVLFTGFTVKNALGSTLKGGWPVRVEIYAKGAMSGVTYTISYCNLYGTNNADEAEDYGFYNSGNKADVVFTHNMITQTGANAVLVEVCTGATEISFNTLDPGCYGCDAIFFMTYNGIDVTALQNVSCNTLDMSTGGTFDYAHRASAISFNTWPIAPDAKFTNVAIQGNTITNLESYRRGVGFWNGGGSGGGVISPLVGDNTITGLTGRTESYGIDFIGANATTNATIINNTISNCDYGIYLREADCTPGAKIIYNNIIGNTVGLDNTAGTSAVDAQYNWWGDSSGPQPLGTGDPVTANVNYTAYLTSPVPSSIYIDPASVNKTPSDVSPTFTVTVTFSQFSYLKGFEINLTWDSSLISFVSADKTYLDTLWGADSWTAVSEVSGTGFYELAAATTSPAASNTGASVLFSITFHADRASNFPLSTPIHFEQVKLSDNATDVPNSIPYTATDGTYTMSAIVPDLEFKVLKYDKKTDAWNPISSPYKFEYGNYFLVEVYVTDVVSLINYSLAIDFSLGLASYQNLSDWGIFGTGHVTYTPGAPSAIQASGGGSAWSGAEGLLFSMMFHVEFAPTADHIWKYGNANSATFPISIADATLGFESMEIILKSGIAVPSDLTIETAFVRGDVDCNGVVNMADIGDVAFFYGKLASVKPEYDLTNDGIVDIYDIVTIATNYLYGMDP